MSGNSFVGGLVDFMETHWSCLGREDTRLSMRLWRAHTVGVKALAWGQVFGVCSFPVRGGHLEDSWYSR